MQIVSGVRKTLEPSMMSKMDVYRHRVFIQTLGWQLKSEAGFETDQFDRDDTVYIIGVDGFGSVIGSARLLPTTRPYLLQTKFPELMAGQELPNSADVWELSRFAAVEFGKSPGSQANQLSSPLAVGLLRASIERAAGMGAKQLVTVSPRGVERLLHRCGFDARRAGPPTILQGNVLVACIIECSKG